MYLIAALMFAMTSVVGLVGDNRAYATFIVLSIAFAILALNAGHRRAPATTTSDRTEHPIRLNATRRLSARYRHA